MEEETPDSASKKKMIHRIHRVQGQLAALERGINDDKPCEELVIQAQAIERAVASLMIFILHSHLDTKIRDQIQDDPNVALQDMQRLLQLVGR